ncbi:SH3 domain-containing protein (plasmid) [Pseudoalteromonas lipolytica]
MSEHIKRVNLRAQATSSSELVGNINAGEKYAVIGTRSTGSWLNI